MAKAKKVTPVPRKTRRRYEYDHEYGLHLGTARKTSRGGVSAGRTPASPAKAVKRKSAAKKR